MYGLPFMLSRNLHGLAAASISVLFVVTLSFAVVVHDTVRYEHAVRSIRGKVTGYGQVVPKFWVDVYDNAQVCLDDAMTPVEKRKRQTKVASVQPDAKGEFKVKRLPKGFYEIEFGNRDRGGYNTLSVLINVDAQGTNDKVCVDLGLEGGPGQSTVKRCSAE